jgi:hypothetical protein
MMKNTVTNRNIVKTYHHPPKAGRDHKKRAE